MVYDEKARIFALKAKGLANETAIDPATIMLCLELLKEIISLYKSCHRPATMAADNMKEPGVVARRRLRKLIAARQLPEGVTAKAMETAALETGKTMTLQDVTEMYAA